MQSIRSYVLHALILLEKTGLGAHMSQIIDDFDGKQDPGRDMYRCSDDFDFWKRSGWNPISAEKVDDFGGKKTRQEVHMVFVW